jgi:membrane protease YdiL (CAAX protease family)
MSLEPLSESQVPPPTRIRIDPAQRIVALLEVILCSDFPTQLVLGATFYAFGFQQEQPDGTLNLAFIAVLSLVDAVVLIGLILFFMRAHAESPRDLFFGRRSIGEEARLGLPLSFAALGTAFAAILLIHQFAPWLRTEEKNPLQDLLTTPHGAAIMAVVLVVAGGIREEIQRAFLLRRFEQWLGGPMVGVVVTSIGFGAGHIIQGVDVAIVTGLLGLFWAVVYLRRRSVVAPVVSHSGFNLLQLAQFLIAGR